MTDSTGVSEWVFNTVGQVTSLTTPQTTAGALTYAYNTAGQLTSMTEPGVGTTSYTYDKFGRSATLTNPFSETTTWEYDACGRLFKQIFDDGMYQKSLYDSRGRLEKRESWHSSGILMRYQYWYNAASQVTHALENAKDVYYDYDDIGQLIEEEHATLAKTLAYTYDANGNRLTRSKTGQTTENYTYDAGDKLTAITGGNDPRTFGYDAAGRTTSIVRGAGTTSFTYDFESRVTSMTRPGSLVDNYTYNGLAARVGQSGSSGTKTFKRAGIGATSTVLSDGLANFTPGISERRSGVTTYSHAGLKNTNRQHEDGAAVWSAARTFDAFGNDMASGWGTFKGPFGYGGQFGYEEDATGLKLLGHRYYDSAAGRFLTRDPAKEGRNWFTYCENDPVNAFDADGLKKKLIILLGDLSDNGNWENGLDVAPLIELIEKTYGNDYDVELRSASSQQAVVDAIVDADALIMIGHGAPFALRKKQREFLTDDTLVRARKERFSKGKGRLDFIRVYSCCMFTSESDRKQWLLLTDKLFGFEDNCKPGLFGRGKHTDLDEGGKWWYPTFGAVECPAPLM